MPVSCNHRLAAREHLAEAAALHGEGSLGAAVRRLRAAAQAAVAAVVERSGGRADAQVLPPPAAEALRAHGIAPGRVRAVLHDLALDCYEQLRGAPTQLGSAAVAQAIDAVQALVDVASGVLRPVPESRADPEWDPALPESMRVPDRPGPWLAAERRRRRRRRARATLVGAAIAMLMAAAPTAAWLAGGNGDPAAKLDVMARTSALASVGDESARLGRP